ncbi:unnamed protein product [Alopecurus aequalis]
MCYPHLLLAVLLSSVEADQVGDTSVTEICSPDGLMESFRRRGCGLMFFLLLISWLILLRLLHKESFLCGEQRLVNSLIDRGEFWRLATSSLLHGNLTHLAFNCFSLNSIGPAVELVTGPRRFLAVYFTSALAGSVMSYFYCQSPSVGASGAIFGLVGAYAVYTWRHRKLLGRGKESLEQIARVVVLNMGMGLLSRGIDNWGHLGGLLGGVAMAWFLGPDLQYQYVAKDGRVVFKDNAPFPRLINGKRSQ